MFFRILILACSVLLFVLRSAVAQYVPVHHSDQEIYEFLEEMSSIKVVQLNSAVLPLSRVQIHDVLWSISDTTDRLNKRQRDELAFYKQDFIKEDSSYVGLDYIGKGLKKKEVFPLRKRIKRHDLFHYKGKLFNISLNARIGGEGWWTKDQLFYHREFGVSLFGNISPYFSFFADIADQHDSRILSDESFLNQRLGVNYKGNRDFSEMRGGIAACAKWGYLALAKDNIKWGTAYNGSNIFSGRTPSFPMIKMHLNPVPWFSFDYIHAWLVSDVIDSSASYQSGSQTRDIMRSKFLAANMFTVRPVKGLYFSFGNSVVYSDRFNPVYLIPFLFYKSVDHTLNSTGSGTNSRGQNSQMFINLVSRNLRFLEVYTSVFVDELRLSSMFKPQTSRNHLSWKAGFRFTAPANVNLSLIFEYTRNNPFVYQHFINTTTFESNSYALGHYLKDNAEEYYTSLIYKPISRLALNLGFTLIRKGETYEYTNGDAGTGFPFIIQTRVKRYQLNAKIKYLVSHGINVSLNYQYLKETGLDAYRFNPAVYSGSPHSLSLGMTIGI
ncbi:MAG: capsule assembly Wzi family protein [Flavobacteriales bacterium]|nr:capsule assembly Wzi family protein [Flavobacteriales bacterium]